MVREPFVYIYKFFLSEISPHNNLLIRVTVPRSSTGHLLPKENLNTLRHTNSPVGVGCQSQGLEPGRKRS